MKHGGCLVERDMLCESYSPDGGIKCVRTFNTGPSLITVQCELTRLSWVKIDIYLSSQCFVAKYCGFLWMWTPRCLCPLLSDQSWSYRRFGVVVDPDRMHLLPGWILIPQAGWYRHYEGHVQSIVASPSLRELIRFTPRRSSATAYDKWKSCGSRITRFAKKRKCLSAQCCKPHNKEANTAELTNLPFSWAHWLPTKHAWIQSFDNCLCARYAMLDQKCVAVLRK